jgi:hypothetical protein
LAKGREAEGNYLADAQEPGDDISACFSGPKPVQAEVLLKWELDESEHTALAETRLLRQKTLTRGNHFSGCETDQLCGYDLRRLARRNLHLA